MVERRKPGADGLDSLSTKQAVLIGAVQGLSLPSAAFRVRARLFRLACLRALQN